MDVVITTNLEPGYLRATVSGRFALEVAKRQFLEFLDALAQARIDHVLLDGRGITGKPRMLERFLYGEFTAAATARLPGHGVFRTSKFAYVLHEPVLDPGRLGERAARRRGMNVRVFDNVEDAVQWLLQPESRDADSHFRPPSQWRTERASAEIDGSAHAPNQRL